MSFDEKYQDGKNGPLSKELRGRLTRLRSIFTLAQIGDGVGLSGPFISQILNEKHPARVDSKHIERIVRAVEDAESKNAKKLGLVKTSSEATALAQAPLPQERNTLDYHLNAIEALGWKVQGLERKA